MMTVTEKKKRAYKRKDRGDHTDTSPLIEKKKKKRAYLSHDLIMEEILTKLPVPTLLKSVLVSKLWYNSIHNDHKRLTYAHLLQSQKHPHVIFSLLNVRFGLVKNTGDPRYGGHFFRLSPGPYHENALQFDKFRGGIACRHIWELVGYCHGLPCMALRGKYATAYIILDPNRRDFLCINPAIVEKRVSSADIICHGFGFDPSEQEYKLVSIFRTTLKELNAVVFTLGTKSWRNVDTATSTPISAHGGRPVTKIRAPTGCDKSAIFCTTSSSSSSGCLVWKIITTFGGTGSNGIQHDNSDETEMLLSFNLHDEKFQFIQLPAKLTTEEQQKHKLVDYPHLLEFKRSPCIARIEKKSGNGIEFPHRCHDGRQGSSSSCCCCCCCTLHLYVLKDNVKQVWVKEESYDVRINSTLRWLMNLGHLAPEPCCFCFGSTTTTPPTRIYSFSDQMFLYWFNGDSLQVYNLGSEKLQLVLPSNHHKEGVIFRSKMKEPRHTLRSGDDGIYCSNMDYQLHCHEENFLSLETFIPEGVTGVDADAFDKSDLGREYSTAFVVIYRSSKVLYLF